MEQELVDFQKLLDDFSKIHIPKEEKTFMGICQYPGSRFEEICSRILAFYFDPKEDHGFRDLWFRSLYLCLKDGGEYNKPNKININLEEHTYCAEESNKRIDIIIETDGSIFVIENKIGASLYNQLDVYTQHIEKKYLNKNYEKIVLTAHSLNSEEYQKTIRGEWKEVSYKDLFKHVKNLIGKYTASSNINQLTFMYDFMNTIKNKMNFMENEELLSFFYKNKEKVDKLIEQYNCWNKEIAEKRRKHLNDLVNNLDFKSGIYDGWLFTTQIRGQHKIDIGIEGYFEFREGDIIGEFNFWITTWKHNLSDEEWSEKWEEILEKIKQIRTLKVVDKKDDGVKKYLYQDPICRNNNETDELYIKRIAEQLKTYYEKLE